jgi:hypothetical protein
LELKARLLTHPEWALSVCARVKVGGCIEGLIGGAGSGVGSGALVELVSVVAGAVDSVDSAGCDVAVRSGADSGVPFESGFVAAALGDFKMRLMIAGNDGFFAADDEGAGFSAGGGVFRSGRGLGISSSGNTLGTRDAFSDPFVAVDFFVAAVDGSGEVGAGLAALVAAAVALVGLLVAAETEFLVAALE